MEGLGAASSVIAVVDISIKVVTICSQYYKAVASARDDIQRLQNQLCGLQTTLNRAREVIESPENDSLSASPEFSSQLDGCWATLNELLSKLEPDETQSVMRKFGLRALKWPFSRKEMERTMSALEQYQRRMMDSLQIDQTNMLLKIQDKMEEISIRPEIELPVGQMPHFVLPFPRDADFISRPEIQSWIRDQYESTKYRAAIVGIGGIGKSQLAIDFAHEVHELYPERSVFWAYGMTKDTLEESYRAIAEELMIPGRNDPKAQILTLVRNWLQREDVAPWLLILDNADDMNTFFQVGSPSPLASYLPKTGNGRILITSRNMSVAERLTGSMKSIKRIPKMNEEEALLLLGNKLSSDFDNAIATRLLESLDYIPLAITQAAAYINRRKISLQKYLDRFKANEKQRTGLLSHDAGDIWRHETVSNSVIVTWQVTLEQILHERPSAADLLSLMSCFQPLGIPQQMLRNYRDDELDKNSKEDTGRSDDEEDDNTLVSSDVEDDRDEGGNTENEFDEALEDDLDVLLGYCLIQESEVTEEEYEMHPLVQLCTRVWLSKANNLSRWNDLFLKLASEMFPAGSYETWDVCNYLLPHIIPVLEKRPVDQPNLLNWARLLTNAAWYTAEMGDFEEADILIQRAVDTRKAILGLHDIHTLRSMAMLAVVYHERGHYEEAEKLQLQVAESANESLEESNDFRIASTSNLSLTYYEQDRFEEAAKLQTQVLESCRLHYGDEDTMTLTAMSNLALTYSSLGRDTESEHLERQALEIRKKTQGDEHPSTLNIMNNLAMRLMTKGEWEEAEKLQLHVLQFRTELVGETHPDTLVNMGNLASIYSGQGRLEEAEKLELRVIESKAELFGADHSFTLKSRANLVYTLENQGRTEEADKLHNEVFEIIKGKLGEEHPDTIDSLYSAGLRLYKRGWLDEAMRLVQEACSRRERVLGPDHKQTKEAKSVYESWQSKLQPSK